MPENKKITGNVQIDQDLVQLFALGEDIPRLKAAKLVIADKNASWEKLTSAMGTLVIRISLILSDPEKAQALLDKTPESARTEVKKAINIVKTNLSGIETHPSVVRLMQAEFAQQAQQSKKRENLKNRITSVRWGLLWQDNEDKLVPTARVSFFDERDELLLDSTLDWDDLAFLIHNCTQMLVHLLRKSEPVAKAELLNLSYAPRVNKRIAEIKSLIKELMTIASTLGIDLSGQEDEQAKENPPKPKAKE